MSALTTYRMVGLDAGTGHSRRSPEPFPDALFLSQKSRQAEYAESREQVQMRFLLPLYLLCHRCDKH